jgi:hypothetical protein
MHMLATRTRRLALSTALLAMVSLLPACGGGGGGGGNGGGGLTASFAGSGTASAANLVRLTGGAVAGTTVTINVVLAGPTTSSDIYSYAFDLALGDTTVAQYVTGSATAGPMFSPGAGQGVSAVASQIGDRVVVGVTLTGGGAGSGDGVAAGEPIIVSLTFRVLKAGTSSLSFAGAPSPTPAALDSNGATIGSITFDGTAASISGS